MFVGGVVSEAFPDIKQVIHSGNSENLHIYQADEVMLAKYVANNKNPYYQYPYAVGETRQDVELRGYLGFCEEVFPLKLRYPQATASHAAYINKEYLD